MKTVVYDSPFIETVVIPAIGKAFKNGEEVLLTDEQADLALKNPHIRLSTDSATPSQKAQSPEVFVTKIGEGEAKPDGGLTPYGLDEFGKTAPPPKVGEYASGPVFPTPAGSQS